MVGAKCFEWETQGKLSSKILHALFLLFQLRLHVIFTVFECTQSFSGRDLFAFSVCAKIFLPSILYLQRFQCFE